MSDDFVKFTAPRADEELHQGVPSPLSIGTSPEDHLPMHIAERNFDKAPPLTEETLICMADKRSFVVRREDGSIRLFFPPAEVKRLSSGQYYVEVPPEPESPSPQIKIKAFAGHYMRCFLDGAFRAVLRVEPIRPECKHYLRMQTDLSSDRESRYFARSCMKQKTEEGEFLSLRDQLVGACSIREPRHLESEMAILDKFDDEKIGQARREAEMQEFDIDAELDKEARRGLGLGVLGG